LVPGTADPQNNIVVTDPAVGTYVRQPLCWGGEIEFEPFPHYHG